MSNEKASAEARDIVSNYFKEMLSPSYCEYCFDCGVKDNGEIVPCKNKTRAAKQCAIIHVQGIIDELDKLHKPEYVTLIIKYEDANYPEEGNGAETMDGYERKDFWKNILEEIQKL
jgi:hypothetical protein